MRSAGLFALHDSGLFKERRILRGYRQTVGKKSNLPAIQERKNELIWYIYELGKHQQRSRSSFHRGEKKRFSIKCSDFI